MNAIKVCFVGNAQTGKTNMVRQLLNQPMSSNNNYYVATLGVEVHPYHVNGKTYNIWDCAGNIKFGGLREGYYIGGQIFIIFTGGDETNNPIEWGHKTQQQYINEIRNVVSNAQIYAFHNPTLDQIKTILN